MQVALGWQQLKDGISFRDMSRILRKGTEGKRESTFTPLPNAMACSHPEYSMQLRILFQKGCNNAGNALRMGTTMIPEKLNKNSELRKYLSDENTDL